MMINCKEASRLASEALECPLSWWKRFKLKIHARLCSWCGGHHRDMKTLRKACQCDESPTEELSPEARERIMTVVREHLDKETGN